MVNLGVLLANYYIALCFHGIRFKVKTTHRVVAMTTLWTLLLFYNLRKTRRCDEVPLPGNGIGSYEHCRS